MTEVAPIHIALLSLLKASLVPARASVIDGYVPEGSDVSRLAEGNMRPTAILIIGDYEDARRYAGITGTRQNLKTLEFMVMCMTADNTQLSLLMDLVDNCLEGRVPTEDCGPIEKFLGRTGLPVNSLMHPLRYTKTLGFTIPINSFLTV